MYKSEVNDVKDYLIGLLKEEEKLLSKGTNKFYNKYSIPIVPINFPTYKEDFYLLLQYLDYGIYFNDVEEFFGICKIKDNQCSKSAEYYDSLNATVIKLMEILDEKQY